MTYMENLKGEDEEFAVTDFEFSLSDVMSFRSRVTSKSCSNTCHNEDEMKMGEEMK